MDIEHFLDRDIKIRDLINDPVLSGIAEKSGVSLESLGSQEKKDTVVKMSTIIGSKIGGGFYQNLRGNYDTPDYGYVVDEGSLIELQETHLKYRKTKLS